MSEGTKSPLAPSTIIDNDGENTLQACLARIAGHGKELWIATAFFSLDALNIVGCQLKDCATVRLLYGNDASATERKKLLDAMRTRSDEEIAAKRLDDPLLRGLHAAKDMIESKRLDARCYTSKKFHAKAYLAFRENDPPLRGVIGSGNFTRPGLTQNIELNVILHDDQAQRLREWYELRWEEAVQDDITNLLLAEIRRQIELYDPYAIYQRALLAWGKYFQGRITEDSALGVQSELDPHQLLGYRRALEVLDREHGVLICDGVGLGKSYIALALMEHFCRLKKNVLLISPKSIMQSSWRSYLAQFLEDFRQPFGTIYEKFMTDFRFDEDDDSSSETLATKQKELSKLIDRCDVIVVDESHNFRTTNALQYENLYKIVMPIVLNHQRRKKVILLTATPMNTSYKDLTAQLALITHEDGSIAGQSIKNLRGAANELDKQRRAQPVVQLSLQFAGFTPTSASETLRTALEAVAIQRKRTTCIELARAAGKSLTFPRRKKPQVLNYSLSDSFKRVVDTTEKRFRPAAAWLKKIRDEYKRAEQEGVEFVIPQMPKRFDGIKFAAFLPEQYRIRGPVARQSFQQEAFLAGLVYVNTLKQLESSPPAFQGILQSLGTSLVARLQYVLKENAIADIAEHLDWIQTQINNLELEDNDGSIEQGENVDINGAETDAWLKKAVETRHLHHKLGEFVAPTFDVERWRMDIIKDLAYLKEIHAETIEAFKMPDYKLERIVKELALVLKANQRVVVFTQSQRTAYYLEKKLQEKLSGATVARIDSNVKQEARDDILHAFCPNYNPAPRLINRKRVDVLVCTDVLSEGVNMQESECILNYDIHWNPVRLIQRIGRVDRRLDPAKNPVPHEISILNCLPPPEIESIIQLVNTVDNRTTMIDQTLGIESSFFKATDPEGTLKEFNAEVDGELTKTDRANAQYVEMLTKPDLKLMATVEQMPPGAFGVWDNAPTNGVFALFEMTASEKCSPADREHFRAIIGMPVLTLEADKKIELQAADILAKLSATTRGEKSANPSDPQELTAALKRLKVAVNQGFRNINLINTIQPKLICWMEMRSR